MTHRVSGPINDCGGVDSDTQADKPEVFAASVSGCEISRGQYRKGIRPEFSRCNSGPQSPIPKPVKSLPTVPPAVLAKAGASNIESGATGSGGKPETGKALDPAECVKPQPNMCCVVDPASARLGGRAPIPAELTALSLALCGPVICVAVMWVISRI